MLAFVGLVGFVGAPASGCPGLDALNPVCQVATVVGSVGGTVAGAGVSAVLSGLSQWVASGAEWLLTQIGDVLLSTTTIDIGADWFKTHYAVMTALAGVVVLPLLVVSTLQAIYRQSASQLVKAFFVQLPLAMLLGVVAIQIVVLSLSATDAMCTAVAGGSGSDIKALLTGLVHGLIVAVGDPALATFVLLMVGLLVAGAAFVLWLELLVRAAAVYVAVLFLPLALATLVWPAISHWCRRLVETLAALILSKFVIVATLSLAAGAVSSGTAGTGDAGSGFASVLAGGALLVLATFTPFVILRLIPVIEAGAVGHLEGARQRSTAVLTRVPRSAASYALREGMAAHSAAKGSDRLLAAAGPVGTGGAGGGGAGGAGGGAGGAGSTGGESASVRVPSADSGGAEPGPDGVAVGLEGSAEAATARMQERWDNPRPKGPKPVLPAPRFAGERGVGVGGSAGGAPLPSSPALPSPPVPPPPSPPSPPAGPTYLGRPEPHHRRYSIERDEHGPRVQWHPSLNEENGKPRLGDGT